MKVKAEMYSEPCQTYKVELFCENSLQVSAILQTLSYMFGRVPDMSVKGLAFNTFLKAVETKLQLSYCFYLSYILNLMRQQVVNFSEFFVKAKAILGILSEVECSKCRSE